MTAAIASAAADDTIQTRTGSPVTVPVLANDRDADGDPLTVVLAEGAANGTLAVDGGVQVRYEPEAGFVGEDSFEYEVSDGYGLGAPPSPSPSPTAPPRTARRPRSTTACRCRPVSRFSSIRWRTTATPTATGSRSSG
ncbi:MAG: Ig-like domain-containing protein [Ilumatobacteraceae bacterium]